MWETEGRDEMRTREDAIRYGLTFDGAYMDRPFPRADWQLVRVRGSKERAEEKIWPCGICRQVLAEFADEEMQVIAAKSESDYRICSFKSLLPHGFSRETLFESTKQEASDHHRSKPWIRVLARK